MYSHIAGPSPIYSYIGDGGGGGDRVVVNDSYRVTLSPTKSINSSAGADPLGAAIDGPLQ